MVTVKPNTADLDGAMDYESVRKRFDRLYYVARKQRGGTRKQCGDREVVFIHIGFSVCLLLQAGLFLVCRLLWM